MKNNKAKYAVLIFAVILVGSALWYRDSQAADTKALSALKKIKPDLASDINYLIELKKRKVSAKDKPAHYLSLGLAWKGLADRLQSEAYYGQALAAYEKGVKITGRRNTVFLNNAGNMAIYLKDYQKARRYYEESIRVAPGDGEGYVRLANLHRDYLKSPRAVVVGIYDNGVKRLINPAPLKLEKEAYLKGLEQ